MLVYLIVLMDSPTKKATSHNNDIKVHGYYRFKYYEYSTKPLTSVEEPKKKGSYGYYSAGLAHRPP